MADDVRARFNRGDFLERFRMTKASYFRPATWNAFLQVVANGIASATLRNVYGGGSFTLSPAGTDLFISASGGGGAAAASPFQVTRRANPDDPSGNTFQARVEYNSSLLRDSWVLSERQTITGLSYYDSAGNLEPASWFNYDKGNDLIWLEVELDVNGVASAAKICSWGQGGAWSPADYPGEFVGLTGTGHGFFQYSLTYDGSGNPISTQYIARIAIFSSVVQADNSVTESQLLSSHVKMTEDSYTGQAYDGTYIQLPISMPMPFCGPYVAAA